MKHNHLNRFLSILIILPVLVTLVVFVILAGCNMPSIVVTPPWEETTPASNDFSFATPLPPLAMTLVSFRVEIPENTPPGEAIYLNLLDEVTGLALNANLTQMQPIPSTEEFTTAGESKFYALTLPFSIGSVVQYRYERQADSIRVAEHLSDGSAVRYRLYHVLGQGSVDDVISRWTDTDYVSQSGRITGSAMDNLTGVPIPNLLVTAGGAQTFTTSDGSFLFEGLPPGVHNLVAFSMDGAYRTFQQGALVAVDSTTPAQLIMKPNEFIKVVFVVDVPENTPPIIPLRFAGNLYQLGNTFATLLGGMSGMPTNMPTLEPLPDGRYTLTLNLPVGADIRYKYTLGDGFWNAEHDPEGNFLLRQIVVPEANTLVEDKVETWYSGETNSITFDVQVPENTPLEDFISIQLNPLYGWTVPLPMWNLGDHRWGYILFSPLNLTNELSYRYCRNGQCGFADDSQTPGLNGSGRTVTIGESPVNQSDQVLEWASWSGEVSAAPAPSAGVPWIQDFQKGIELMPAYNPSWKALYPITLDEAQTVGANLIVLSPTWSYGRNPPGNNPPLLAPIAGRDALWFDLIDSVQRAQESGLNVALKPVPLFAIEANEWWLTAPRDAAWWQVWFEQYRIFTLHHADLATQTNSTALILGGEWLSPALPGGTFPDGTPSGVPENFEEKWRDLMTEVRDHYTGTLLWAMPHSAISSPPSFLDSVDQIYVTLSVYPGQDLEGVLGSDLESWLNNTLSIFQIIQDKPVILALSSFSNPDLQIQVFAYDRILSAINQCDWISGFVSSGFYPPAALQDLGPSVHGKPASEQLQYWFSETWTP